VVCGSAVVLFGQREPKYQPLWGNRTDVGGTEKIAEKIVEHIAGKIAENIEKRVSANGRAIFSERF
jgi:hypothetical protein